MTDRKDKKTDSLAEAFPKEQVRVRELMTLYKDMGQPGMFGSAMLEQVMRRSDVAASSGDVVAMLRSFEEMRGCE